MDNYKIKLIDWIPVIGMISYIQRNDGKIPDKLVSPFTNRMLALSSYNLVFSIPLANLISKGLEVMLN